jgi:hypothetical protein
MRLPSARRPLETRHDRHRHLAAFLQALAKRLRALRLVGAKIFRSEDQNVHSGSAV